MRFHTNNLTVTDINNAANSVGVTLEECSQRGSRSRNRAFEIRLSGNSNRKSQNKNYDAATWDEWGAFIGNLFNADDSLTVPRTYSDWTDFNNKTGYRFENGELPADTHSQHKWTFNGTNTGCAYCSATMNR